MSGFDILYPKVEIFVKDHLFSKEVELSDPQTMRNLSEIEPKEILKTTFKKAIDELTITDRGTAEVKNFTSLKVTKPKIVENQPYLIPKKSVFNKIIGDNAFELEFAAFCENRFNDVVSFAKNTFGDGGVNFSIEYQKEDGNIAQFFPDFLVKTSPSTFFVVETKGREDLDDIRKIKRLATWCKDINAAQKDDAAAHFTYTPVYIKQEKWDDVKKDLKTFGDILKLFKVSE